MILINKQRFHDMNSEIIYLLRRLQILFSVCFKPYKLSKSMKELHSVALIFCSGFGCGNGREVFTLEVTLIGYCLMFIFMTLIFRLQHQS